MASFCRKHCLRTISKDTATERNLLAGADRAPDAAGGAGRERLAASARRPSRRGPGEMCVHLSRRTGSLRARNTSACIRRSPPLCPGGGGVRPAKARALGYPSLRERAEHGHFAICRAALDPRLVRHDGPGPCPGRRNGDTGCFPARRPSSPSDATGEEGSSLHARPQRAEHFLPRLLRVTTGICRRGQDGHRSGRARFEAEAPRAHPRRSASPRMPGSPRIPAPRRARGGRGQDEVRPARTAASTAAVHPRRAASR